MALSVERWMAQGMPVALALELQANLGRKITTSLAGGNHLVTVPDESQCVRHVITGALSVARTYTFPSISGFYFVDNNTTGGQTTNLAVVGGGSVGTATGQSVIVFVDGLALTIEIFGAGGGGGGGSGITVAVAHADSPYAVPPGVGFVTADSSGGDVSVVLPAAAANLSRSIGVVRTSDVGNVTVTSLGGQISGYTSYPINGGRGSSILPNSNGTDWWIY